jgi:hypothetical protein
MERRDLLRMIAAATGTAFIAGNAYAYKLTEAGHNQFSEEDIRLMDEVGETILPTTDTPGAKEAGIGAFMTLFVSECYDVAERSSFRDGLADLRRRTQLIYGRDFMELDAKQKRAFIADLDAEAMIVAKSPDRHYFTMMKQLTLFGFFTSEIGATRVLRYVAVPGRYDGCIPYEGEPSWGT